MSIVGFKTQADLAESCKALLDEELRPFIRRWGLSVDLALCLACKENQADLVEELLKQHANPNAVDTRGRCALKLSLSYAVSARKAIELLLEYKAEVYSADDRLRGSDSDQKSSKILLDNVQCSLIDFENHSKADAKSPANQNTSEAGMAFVFESVFR